MQVNHTINLSLLIICFIIVSLAGCIYQNDTCPEGVLEVRPEVFKAQIPRDLPLPTSDYDIYVIGELYGTQDIPPFFLDYLQVLHDTAGVCDIIIEHAQVYEKEANDYVLGKTETLCE
jgi:hypothetical protein